MYVPNGNTLDTPLPVTPVVIVSTTTPFAFLTSNTAPATNAPNSDVLVTSMRPFAISFTNSAFVKTTGVVMFAYSIFTV